MKHLTDILIVGAGQGGAQVAISLRQGGCQGSITVVGEELDAPYERPPLSKDYLAGDKTADQLLLRQADFWMQNNIQLKLGKKVIRVEAQNHIAITNNGDEYHYKHLVWATGGYARILSVPGNHINGVHVIRNRSQVDLLRAALKKAKSIVVIGGGYVGLEAASILTGQGKSVTIIEAGDRVLARVAGEPISHFFEAEHRGHGVILRTGVTVSKLVGNEEHVDAVVLGNGEEISTDLVIVGIGLVPNQDVLEEAGADCSNGVEVDEYCRTSLPDVFVIGDCAYHPNIFADNQRVRLESVPNAVEQAKTVVSCILNNPKPYQALPWFWSNQYDLKLQTAGLNHGYDETVVRGDPETRRFSLIYLRKGQVVAIDAVNSIKDFIGGKKLVEKKARPKITELSNLTIPLKSLC